MLVMLLALQLKAASNLIVNGDFSSGNTGFYSAYHYSTVPWYAWASSGIYTIGSNPSYIDGSGAISPGDHTTGSGLMFVADGATAANVTLWQETVAVTPNQSYNFSAWVTAMGDLPPNLSPNLQLKINGNNVGGSFLFNTAQWVNMTDTWFSGDSTSATIQLIDLNTQGNGNDFCLDDISFSAIDGLAFLIVRSEPAAGGMVTGGGFFPIDSWQQISAGPSPGWRFVMWEENFSPAMTQRVQVPKEGATYTAKFEPIQDSELSPVLNPAVIQGNNLIISWPTLPGVRVMYQVERRADLNSGDWEVVAPNLEATELNNISVTLPISGMQGYFRVGVIPIVAP